MTTNFTKQITFKKNHFQFYFFPVYIYVNRTSILVFSSQILRGHMTYLVPWRRKRYENVCEIYGTYIKWPQNDL